MTGCCCCCCSLLLLDLTCHNFAFFCFAFWFYTKGGLSVIMIFDCHENISQIKKYIFFYCREKSAQHKSGQVPNTNWHEFQISFNFRAQKSSLLYVPSFMCGSWLCFAKTGGFIHSLSLRRFASQVPCCTTNIQACMRSNAMRCEVIYS